REKGGVPCLAAASLKVEMRPSSSLGEPQKPGGVGWTWIASAPIALARAKARCRPPEESTWAPRLGASTESKPGPGGHALDVVFVMADIDARVRGGRCRELEGP